MGQDLFEQFPEARARFEAANDLLGFALTDVMFGAGGDANAEAEALKQTDITQPALYVHSLAVMTVLESQGVVPDMTAGHSLGEYSALAAAGAITFEAGLQAVRLRGQLMAGAGGKRPGTMAAIIGMDDATVEAVCAEATQSEASLVQPANFNSAGQVVISGDVDAVQRAMAIADGQGARKVIALPVSGAFHSPLMQEARDGLAEGLASLVIDTPRCPVYLNVTAQPTIDPEEIRTRLLEQLTAPVRWSQTLQQMQADGASRFIEVGAGRVLSGLVKRTLGRRTETATYGKAAEVEALVSAA